jgi:hypothetical protein
MRHVSYRRNVGDSLQILLYRNPWEVEYLRVSGSLNSSRVHASGMKCTSRERVENTYTIIQYAFSKGNLNLGNAASRDSWLVTFRVRSVCHLGHVTLTANSVKFEVTASGHFSSDTWCCYEQATCIRSKKGRRLTLQGLTCIDVGPWCFPELKKARGSLC